jgi:CHAT domain-containing protein
LNAKHILLSLDGRLRYVPFEALHDGTNYLLEKYAFSIHDDLIMRKEKFIQSRFDRIAGFGVSVSIGGFAALPAVNDELRKIIQNSSGGIFPGKIVLNKDFTADVFQRSIKEGYPAIHVATHFRFSPGNEFRSFLLLGDGARLYLEAFKDIDLQSVDLITFSACETGLGGGKDEKGREIVGLTYVSQLRGARSVIASLWAVSDLSTSELMARIYRHIGSGRESKASALRKAKLELFRSDSFQHPFHWAGFQLYGQWH